MQIEKDRVVKMERNGTDNILKALENVGIFIEKPDEVDLSNFFESSIQFMTFIVEIEDIFQIEIPNELLVFENFTSVEKINDIIASLKE